MPEREAGGKGVGVEKQMDREYCQPFYPYQASFYPSFKEVTFSTKPLTLSSLSIPISQGLSIKEKLRENILILIIYLVSAK